MSNEAKYRELYEAEAEYRRALHYNEWLERRMLEAPDEESFSLYADKLEAQFMPTVRAHDRAHRLRLEL